MLKTALAYGTALALSLGALWLGRPAAPRPPNAARPTPAPPPPASAPEAPDRDPEPVAPTKPPAPVGPATARAKVGRAVVLRGALGHRSVEVGARSEVYALLEVSGHLPARQPTSGPLDVALVLDRSGSMAGTKLAAAKRAARRAIARLGPEDHVTLVAYGSSVDVLAERVAATADGKARLDQAVEAIEDFGGTNISEALEAAARILARAPAGAGHRRIVLLSDGEANEGLTSPRALRRLGARWAREGITLSTLGLGAEFNEDLLLALADQSGGHFRYLAGPEDLVRALEAEVRSAQRVVARDLRLSVEALGPAEIVEVLGWEAAASGNEHTVRLKDVSAGEKQRVVLRLRVAPTRRGVEPVLRAALRYRLAGRETTRTLELLLSQRAVEDAAEVAAAADPEVLDAAARARAAEAAEDAAHLYEAGRADEARTVLLERLAALLRTSPGRRDRAALRRDLDTLRAQADFEAPPSSDEGRRRIKRLKHLATEYER